MAIYTAKPRFFSVARRNANNTNTNTNMTTSFVTKSETQNIKLVVTNADETIRTQGYYWTAQEARLAAQKFGGFYTIRNTDTGKLIEAEW